MKTDIQNREDIDALMKMFYSRAIKDDVIGYIFTDVARLDLDRHLPIIGDFWETIVFHTGDYQRHGRHPLLVHGELTEKTPLLPEHFTRWLEIFTETVDGTFSGERADFIKVRARAIADRMLHYVGEINERLAIPRDNPAEVDALRRRSCHERS
ncbi:MAG TPA: group III truncated hemoglobin [Pyrinomonadaceae bacterium]|nr:group III truncated hemoglobin [Acidobacteriota bacterium]HQZ97044.1 group III truncated hemoglobin [Pyrinomonadaceae bacterium]